LGTYSVQFSHWTGVRGRVVVFEPQPMVFKVLTANAMGAGMGNMELYNAALGFKRGVVHMAKAMLDGGSKGRDFEEVATARGYSGKVNFGGRSLGSGGEKARMVTLDSLNISRVSFIKVDVQGSENMLVFGARETILREKPVINMELNSGMTSMMKSPELIAQLRVPDDVARFEAVTWLISIGYREVDRLGEDVFFAHPFQPKLHAARKSISWPSLVRPKSSASA